MDTSVASEKVNGQQAAEPPPNTFDPSRLRLSQNFAAAVGVKKLLTTVPCRKPNRQEFVQVRAGESWRLETGIFEDKQNRETYLVEPKLWSELMGEIFAACLFFAVTRQGDVMLWPVRLPGADGKSNPWNESAFAAAKQAESRWVRVAANMAAGMYDVFAAAGDLAEPEWPELPFEEILRLAFKDRFIRDMAHPAVKALRGEV
jgi:hypothetical protein